MKPTYLTILAGGLVVALSLAVNLRLARSHHRALENIEALSEENAHLRRHISTLADSLATHHLSVPRQRLSRGELREFRPEEYDAIRGLGVRPRRVESIASVVSITGLDLLLEHDTMAVATIHDTLRPLVWHDGWVGVTLTPRPEGVGVRVTSTDTLHQVVHRVPHRWWIFSWGTRAIRQEIASSNPHTRLVYAEYIVLE